MTQNQTANIRMLKHAYQQLGPIADNLVLVGGCAVGLVITDTAFPDVRATDDVDVVAELVTPGRYYKEIHERLRQAGFVEDADINIRWNKGNLRIDVMLTIESQFGPTNSWYQEAVRSAVKYDLGDSQVIKHATAPVLIASKIESFHNRGNGDFTHHDVEDIITIFNGRKELVGEIKTCANELRDYVCSELETFLADTNFTNTLPGHLRPYESPRATMIIERIRQVTGQ